jgi:hypothetical protein
MEHGIQSPINKHETDLQLLRICAAVGSCKSRQQAHFRRHLAYLLHRQICLQVLVCIGSPEAVITGQQSGGSTVRCVSGRLVRFAFKLVGIVLW